MFINNDEQTIIAQCTPKGVGALALLRISGLDAIEVASKISKLASKKNLISVPTHTIHYGWVIDDSDKHIDQVLFLLMQGPNTFTGQDTVEITCHNNPFIIEAIIQATIKHGARLAHNGEFTKRAVLNNKIDLIQAESINELIHANTQISLKKSLALLGGSFSNWIKKIETDLIKALALSEASFEFIDEENITFEKQIKHIIENALQTINQLKKTFNQQQQIRQGIRIALIGAVNAGKSSLFNALLNQKKAIVTNIAGTTRDAIEAGLYKNGNYWTLIDTAGLRKTNDLIEQEGINRSFDEAKLSDIIMLVLDCSRPITQKEITIYQKLLHDYKQKIIMIKNKIDLPQHVVNIGFSKKCIEVSTKKKIHISLVEQAIQNKINELFTSIDSPFLLNQRQFNLLLELEKNLNSIHCMINTNVQYELLSYHLNDAIAHLSELTGKSISEQSMDAIFKEFCIGK